MAPRPTVNVTLPHFAALRQCVPMRQVIRRNGTASHRCSSTVRISARRWRAAARLHRRPHWPHSRLRALLTSPNLQQIQQLPWKGARAQASQPSGKTTAAHRHCVRPMLPIPQKAIASRRSSSTAPRSRRSHRIPRLRPICLRHLHRLFVPHPHHQLPAPHHQPLLHPHRNVSAV